MSQARRLLVTIATYNEIENLPRLIEAILQQLPSADILVIDDNSPDGTGEWCDKAATQEPRLGCLHREGKLGLGSATVAGMKHAIAEEYDWVINLDADFSHHPRYLPAMVSATESADSESADSESADSESADSEAPDVIIGSRYVPQGGTKGWPLTRRLMSRGVNFYARVLLGLPIRDCSGAFRCCRVSLLRQLDFDKIRSRGYSFQEEILWRLKGLGARFHEVPIIFEDRLHGQSKINGREAIAALWIIFRLGLSNWLRIPG